MIRVGISGIELRPITMVIVLMLHKKKRITTLLELEREKSHEYLLNAFSNIVSKTKDGEDNEK